MIKKIVKIFGKKTFEHHKIDLLNRFSSNIIFGNSIA